MLFVIESPAQTSVDANTPSIDGKIKNEEWKDARIFTNFYIIFPKTEEKYYDSTIVFVKQTSDALYFAFKFWPQGKVISKSLVRDRSFEEENEFFILLDLENRNQNGYFFAFSYLNNQRDALIYNQVNKSFEWDWVWECKSTIFAEAKNGKPGYIETEVKIPVDKIQNKNKKQIGIDIQMFAYKPDGNAYMYSITPNSEITTIKGTYKFDLVKPFEERLNFNFNLIPFVVGSKFNSMDYSAQYGGDANISFDKHKLKGTLHTDQSTLEADPFTFTFYRKPIFLQEKRPFFSKDLDIYASLINLFYTRAIDSIDYGANYTFRSNKVKTGIIYVEEPKDTAENRRKFFIARPNTNFKDFNLGGAFIYNSDKTSGYFSKVISFDGTYRPPKTRFGFMGQYAMNFGEAINGKAYKLYSFYQSNGDGPFYDIFYNRVDKNFNSRTIFNSDMPIQNDYDESSIGVGYAWIINRKFFPFINLWAGHYRARQLSSNFYFQERYSLELFYKVTDWLSFNHSPEFNRPNDYDEKGNLIRRNNFLMNNNVKIVFGNNALQAGFYGGKYFGSTLKNPYLSLDMIFFDRLSFKFNYNYQEVFDIKQSIYSFKLDYKIMDKLYLRSFFQKDTYTARALWNTLLQYEFFAGSNIYFVLNLEGDKLQNTRRYFKVSYEFNF